ncbi:MAG TPA: HD domain-containing phosphohydrolase [Aromatoleum sp.]|uniref:HD-GYP domain-containing protein n=1 Tax=Aromatoleum sp. TaxID=2307007 RepID=UPI002B4611D7|nr:HD domain-containing phosphohydrolase [Aromatoleum sp.]HJV27068.1 HD domain-containing phosphohydrolase [Aromatoleum sp.]
MAAKGAKPPATARQELVAAADAAVGMFVVELDRPWIETPFLLQGFLIEDEETLAKLRSLCRFVYIDRTRSIAEHYAEAGAEDVASTVGRSAARRPIQFEERPADEQQPGFLEVLALVRKGRVDAAAVQRLAGEARADRPETQSVERELLRATPSFAHAENVFDQVLADVRENRRPDLDEVAGCVDNMMQSVKRNPDALLWLIRLKRYDRSSYHHALDVTVHMMVFARHLGFSDEGTTVMGVAGMMQDIGKLRLPERVLKKAGRLSRLEMEIAKAHVEFSTRIIEESGNRLPGLIEIVSRHHERLDGSGYPAGLAGQRIGLRAEMAGVVDSFCAMTSKRAYDEPLSTQRALESLIRQRDVKFSAAVVDAFIQCVGLYPAGTLVELNSGEIAVVISQNRVRRLLPRVLVLLGPDKTPNLHPPVLDLLYAPARPDGEPYRVVRALPSGAFDIDPTEFYLS